MEKYLQYTKGVRTIFTLPATAIPLARVKSERIPEIAAKLKLGLELHALLNVSAGSDRASESIVKPFLLALDLDRKIQKPELQRIIKASKPGLVVNSSPGKFHLYWRCDGDSLSLDDWQAAQTKLYEAFGGDENLKNTTASLRIPGVLRRLKDGTVYTPRSIYLDKSVFVTDPEQYFAHLKKQTIVKEIEERREQGALQDPGEGRNAIVYKKVKNYVRQLLEKEAPLEDIARKGKLYAVKLGAKQRPALESSECNQIARGVIKRQVRRFKASQKVFADMLLEAEDIPVTETEEDSLAACAQRLAEHMWEEDEDRCVRAYQESAGLGHHTRFAELVRDYWGVIGGNRLNGPTVVVRMKGTHRDYLNNLILDPERVIVLMSYVVTCLIKLIAKKVAKAVREGRRTKVAKLLPSTQIRTIGREVVGRLNISAFDPPNPPEIIVFQNGTLNLDSGEFNEGRSGVSKASLIVAAHYLPGLAKRITSADAEALENILDTLGTRFMKFFNDWLPDDLGALLLIAEYAGYCLTTDFSKQKFMFLYGPTGAGKGSIAQVICGLVGPGGYTSIAYPEIENKFVLGECVEKQIVTIEEAEAVEKEHARRLAILKKLTGGEVISVEKKFMRPETRPWSAKFIVQSNDTIRCDDPGGAIAARMVPLALENSFRAKPSSKPPSRQILENKVRGVWESDILATLFAKTWMYARQDPDTFVMSAEKYSGSRSREHASAMVTDHMDIVASFIKRNTKVTGLSRDQLSLNDIVARVENAYMDERRDFPVPSVIGGRITSTFRDLAASLHKKINFDPIKSVWYGVKFTEL